MLVMPPPKKPDRAEAKKPEEEKKPQRDGKPINVWLPLPLHAALLAFMTAQRVKPKLTDTVELAIQEFLKREGFWPPADE